MTSLRLRAAEPSELEALSDLCFRSKAFWGYDSTFMEAARAELTISAERLAEEWVRVACDSSRILGLVSVSTGDEIYLEKLFIDPKAMGLGVGRFLFQNAVDFVANQGGGTMIIESDPGARPFYERMGAKLAGEAPSGSIPGRMLPRLTLDIAAA